MKPLKQQPYSAVGQPCRNFNIMTSTVMTDPWDGREKLVLSNFAAGETGCLIFIDTHTGDGEKVPLPADEGAWGLVNWRNERLIVGTCPNHAYLHAFDLKTRTWLEPLRDKGEKYFWDIALGSDGMIYGGTWPGCSLLRYDPERHLLENMGRASDNPKNLYSRYLHAGLPGYILFCGGYDEMFLKAYHIETGTFRDFGIPGWSVREVTDFGIVLEKGEELAYFDRDTFAPITDDGTFESRLTPRDISLPNGQKQRVHRLANGRLAGVRGQDYFIMDSPEQSLSLQKIPVDAPPTAIHTLTYDENTQTVWGSCGFGQTIFRFDPADGSFWNSSSVCDSGGEVYGMRFVYGRLFMSAYVGGDHVVYNPAAPWDQLGNRNPMALRAVRPDYVRPEGRSVIGPDGGVWTGWSAKYGTYGGALSRIDPVTLEVSVWPEPIPGQAVAGVAADDRYVYFTTNGSASGLAYNEEAPCHFAVWSPEGGLVYQHAFEAGLPTGNGIAAAAGNVFIGVGGELRMFNAQTQAFVGAIPLAERCRWIVAMGDDASIAAFCGTRLLLVEATSGAILQTIELPGKVHAAMSTRKGELYFAVGSTLYRMSGEAAE